MASTRPTRGIGTAGATLKRPTREKPVSLVAALAAADEAPATGSSEGLRRLPLSAIAEHPRNPREVLGDLTELTASVRAMGILQPPVVIPAAAFRSNWPDHADAIGDAAWVIVAGHRRRAAAAAAELAEIDVIVREDLATQAATVEAFVVENVHRKGLEPQEEAQAYSLLVDLGIGQREIARRTGVSQSHVSKRLALLKLPQQAQDALAQGDLVITEALALAAVKPAEQAQVWGVARDAGVSIASAVSTVQRDTERRQRREAAQVQAADEGLETIDPAQRFGSARWDHLLRRQEDIDGARTAGTLLAGVDDSGLSYYSATPAAATSQSDNGDSADRRKAMKARRAACAELVAKPPGRGEAVADLIRAVTGGNLEHGEAVRLVYGWLGSKYPADSEGGNRGWLDLVMAEAGDDVRLHLAWALTVARDEVHASATGAAWGPVEVRHLARLSERSGYAPTPWEQAQLANLDPTTSH